MQNQHSSPFRPPLYVEKKKKNVRERERELLNRRKAEQKELKLIQDARQAATPTLSYPYPIHSFLFGLPSAVTPRLGTDGDRNNKTYRSRQTAKTNLAIYNPQRRDRDARPPHGVSRSRLFGVLLPCVYGGGTELVMCGEGASGRGCRIRFWGPVARTS